MQNKNKKKFIKKQNKNNKKAKKPQKFNKNCIILNLS